MAIQNEPYEFMVKYTPQREWIEGKGVFLWLAFFFSEIGAGIYFVSLFYGSPGIRLSGWLITLVLGGAFHLAYLGKPMRGWRILLHFSGSELSRGLWVLLFFALVGFFQLVPVAIPDLPWTGQSPTLKIVMGIICILVITHGFLTMGIVRALPAWNSAVMIPLSVVSGIWVGSQFVELMLLLGDSDVTGVESWSRWLFFGYVAALGVYLWGGFHSTVTARASAKRILAGDISKMFYVGLVVIGILIPLFITFVLGEGMTHPGPEMFLIRLICIVTGDLFMRYSVMRSALYAPLLG